MTDDMRVPEARIRADAGVVTLINVFTVDAARQQELVEAWQQATEEVMRHQPGFVSASIHRGLDGTKVINYAQWHSRDAFAAMFRDPRASAELNRLAEIGSPAPTLCEVVSVHRSNEQQPPRV